MSDQIPPNAAPGKELTPAARRALEEAAARHAADKAQVERIAELRLKDQLK